MTVEDGCRLGCSFAVIFFTNLTFHAHVPLADLLGGLLRWSPVCIFFCENQDRPFARINVTVDAGGSTSEKQSAPGPSRMMVVCHKSSHSFASADRSNARDWLQGSQDIPAGRATIVPPSQEARNHSWPTPEQCHSASSEEKKLQHVLAPKWNNLKFTSNLNSK